MHKMLHVHSNCFLNALHTPHAIIISYLQALAAETSIGFEHVMSECKATTQQMLWVLHTRSLTHRMAWNSSSLVFTLPQDRCCFILRKSSSKLVAAASPQLEIIVRWITSSWGACNSVSACCTSYLWSMQLWNMVWQSASSGGACKRQCMLQYGVHKLGLLCNKLFPQGVPASVSAWCGSHVCLFQTCALKFLQTGYCSHLHMLLLSWWLTEQVREDLIAIVQSHFQVYSLSLNRALQCSCQFCSNTYKFVKKM